MSKKFSFRQAWPPGFATIIAFLLASYVATVTESFELWIVVIIACSILGEVWMARLRSKNLEKEGKLVETVAAAKAALTFALIGVMLIIITSWILLNLYPDVVMEESWVWLAFHGLLWDVGVACIAAIGIAIAAIIRCIKTKKYGLGWSIYALIIAIATLFVWFNLIIPFVFNVNINMRDTLEKVRLERTSIVR